MKKCYRRLSAFIRGLNYLPTGSGLAGLRPGSATAAAARALSNPPSAQEQAQPSSCRPIPTRRTRCWPWELPLSLLSGATATCRSPNCLHLRHTINAGFDLDTPRVVQVHGIDNRGQAF